MVSQAARTLELNHRHLPNAGHSSATPAVKTQSAATRAADTSTAAACSASDPASADVMQPVARHALRRAPARATRNGARASAAMRATPIAQNAPVGRAGSATSVSAGADRARSSRTSQALLSPPCSCPRRDARVSAKGNCECQSKRLAAACTHVPKSAHRPRTTAPAPRPGGTHAWKPHELVAHGEVQKQGGSWCGLRVTRSRC